MNDPSGRLGAFGGNAMQLLDKIGEETGLSSLEIGWAMIQQNPAEAAKFFGNLTQQWASQEWAKIKEDPWGWLGRTAADYIPLWKTIQAVFCFPAGTPVATADGLKPIEDISEF